MPTGGSAGDGDLSGHDRGLRGPRDARGCAPRHACMDVRPQHGAPSSWWGARRVGGVGMRASVASAGSATPGRKICTLASHIRDALSPYCSLDDVLTDYEPFSVKLAPKRDNGTRRQGATERAHHLPSVAPERGMTPGGWPHPCHVSVWPAPVFRLTFSPIFTEYIDIFRIRVFLGQKGTPCPPPRVCRFMTSTATGCISPAPSVQRSAPPPKPLLARSAPIAGHYCIPAVAPRRPWRSPPIGSISRRRSSPLRVRRNAAPASIGPCPSRPASSMPSTGAWPPRPCHPVLSLDVEPENGLHPRHRDHGTGRHRWPPSEPQRAAAWLWRGLYRKRASRSISCSAGWAMPSSRRRPSMPTRWARKNATLPHASGPDTPDRSGSDVVHDLRCLSHTGFPARTPLRRKANTSTMSRTLSGTHDHATRCNGALYSGLVHVFVVSERLSPLWRHAVAVTHRDCMAMTTACHCGPSVALLLVTATRGACAAEDRRMR